MKGGDYCLLMDETRCPKCMTRRDNITGFCHNCGLKLFASTDYDFHKFELDNNIRNWWAFHRIDGWKFRDFFMVENAKPNHRVLKIDPKALDPTYGKTTTPAEVANAFRKPENRIRHRRTK